MPQPPLPPRRGRLRSWWAGLRRGWRVAVGGVAGGLTGGVTATAATLAIPDERFRSWLLLLIPVGILGGALTAIAQTPAPPPDPPGPRVHGHVSPAENRQFTGRERELDTLRTLLTGGHTAAVVAAHGMGGVGKTQLALEYVHRYRSDYPIVGWLDAEIEPVLVQQLADLAPRLGLHSLPAQDLPTQVQAVRQELARREDGWLLVFDNAPNPEIVDHYQPYRPVHGHILVTSRQPTGWEEQLQARTLPVDVFPPAEAHSFLARRLPTATVEEHQTLADRLGYLPLALEQAAAYLQVTGKTVPAYLQDYETRPWQLLDDPDAQDNRHPKPATRTLELSLQQLRQDDPAAVHLLELLAWFAPEPVPLRLFTQTSETLPPALADLGEPARLHTAVQRLRALSLLTVSTTATRSTAETDQVDPAGPDGHVQVHRVVQDLLRHLPGSQRKRRARGLGRRTQQPLLACRLLSEAWPGWSDNPEQWPWVEQLLPHALAALDHAREAGREDEGVLWLLLRTGSYFKKRGQLPEARRYGEQALTVARRVLGDEHPDTLTSMNNLAGVLRDQGALPEARHLHEQELTVQRRVLGDEHPDTLTSMNNLALVLQAQGALPEARQL